MEKTIRALHSKGARELVVIKADDFRWLLALAREKEEPAGRPITVEKAGLTVPVGFGAWLDGKPKEPDVNAPKA
jgi:hypothetical protein